MSLICFTLFPAMVLYWSYRHEAQIIIRGTESVFCTRRRSNIMHLGGFWWCDTFLGSSFMSHREIKISSNLRAISCVCPAALCANRIQSKSFKFNHARFCYPKAGSPPVPACLLFERLSHSQCGLRRSLDAYKSTSDIVACRTS